MDLATALAIGVPPLTTLGGVYLGWRLNQRSAEEAREQEWDRQDREAMRDRQEAAAAQLHQYLVDAFTQLPRITGPAGEIGPKLGEVQTGIWDARARAAVLADEEIEKRFRSLDVALSVLAQHAAEKVRQAPALDPFGQPAAVPNVNPWSVTVAADELLQALAAFQRREPAPPKIFPTAPEVAELSWHETRGDVGLGEVDRIVRKRLIERRRATGGGGSSS